MKKILRAGIIKDIFRHPKKALAEIDEKSESYFIPAIIILVFSAISSIIADLDGIWNQAIIEETTINPIDYAYTLLITTAGGFLGTGLILWVARKMYKVETTYKRVFSTFQFAGLPYSILSIPIGVIIGLYLMSIMQKLSLEFAYNLITMSFLMLAPLLIHLIILSVFAAKQSLQLSTGQIIAVWIVSAVIAVIIFIPIGIVMAVLGVYGAGWFEI